MVDMSIMNIKIALFTLLLVAINSPIQAATTTFIKPAPKQGKSHNSDIIIATVEVDKYGMPQAPKWAATKNKQLLQLAQADKLPESHTPKRECDDQDKCVNVAHTKTYRWIFVAPKTDKPIRLVRSVKVPYPTAARERDETGQVELRLTIAPNGSVADVSVVQSSGSRILDRHAVRTTYQQKFAPIRHMGKPVYASTKQTLVFEFK